MYDAEKLIKLAKRDNNPSRDYLLINIFQGKHYPVYPKDCFDMCKTLAAKIKKTHYCDRLLIIGFAEAATAIGAIVADFLKAPYIQTSREILDGHNYISFSEDHSHAKEQRLYVDGFLELHHDFDRIVFVEDEITTGNTLKNACKVLNEICQKELSYTIASLLDCTHIFQKKELFDFGIDVISLMEMDKEEFSTKLKDFTADGNNYDYSKTAVLSLSAEEKSNLLSGVTQLHFVSKQNARLGMCPTKAKEEIKEFFKTFTNNSYENFLKNTFPEDITFLVLGTEEFMFPSLIFGKELGYLSKNVSVHSTARSPMLASLDEKYPLHSRYFLPSVYDEDRKTFIYNLSKSDCTFVFTDSTKRNSLGMFALIKALKDLGNEKIYWVWCEYEEFL